ncbi:MAG: TIGR00730 family Rossman fold protein [Anaerolineaceae bacterium]|nr:TIGR00730 family Rossman fold protein [Anaerolineaceae bacterium]
MKRICVYCGSNHGVQSVYTEYGMQLGNLLAEKDIQLIYGGGKVGLMGKIADAVIQAGGAVTGVITEKLKALEVEHRNLTRLEVVGSMHERKARMAELADGFIAMPGGFGTLDEMFEILTWAQLGLHQKPCGFLNVNGFYDDLIRFLDHVVAQGFIRDAHRQMILIDEKPFALLEKMANYKAPTISKLVN